MLKKSTNFFFKKLRYATIKHFETSIKLGTSVYVMISTCKKDPIKNLKVAFFWIPYSLHRNGY